MLCLAYCRWCFAGAAHVDRAHRVCLGCNTGAVGIDKHLVFECVALASLRSQYAGLFTYSADTMRSVCAQPDHIEVFYSVVDCLDIMMIGTSLLLPLPTQLTSLEFMAGLPSWCAGYSCTHVSLGDTYSGDYLKEGLNVRSRGRILQQSKTLKPTQRNGPGTGRRRKSRTQLSFSQSTLYLIVEMWQGFQ